jgi:hypothetical protein
MTEVIVDKQGYVEDTGYRVSDVFALADKIRNDAHRQAYLDAIEAIIDLETKSDSLDGPA